MFLNRTRHFIEVHTCVFVLFFQIGGRLFERNVESIVSNIQMTRENRGNRDESATECDCDCNCNAHCIESLSKNGAATESSSMWTIRTIQMYFNKQKNARISRGSQSPNQMHDFISHFSTSKFFHSAFDRPRFWVISLFSLACVCVCVCVSLVICNWLVWFYLISKCNLT